MLNTGRILAVALLLFGLCGMAYAQSSRSQPPYSSSPWSQSKNQYNNKPSFPNGNAGYPGSDLPPSEYQPDARSREYYRERTSPLPPLDNGMYSRQPNPYCTGEHCGR